MSGSDNTSIVIILGLILLLSIFYVFSGQPIHNDGVLKTKNDITYPTNGKQYDEDEDAESNMTSDDASSDNSSVSVTQYRNVSEADGEEDNSVDSSLEIIKERSMGMNGPYFRRKNGNKYKYDSYRALGAGTDLKQVDKQFNVNDVKKNYNDRFVPMDETDGNQAPVNIKNIKGTERDKYDSNNFLPHQDQEKDWFETIETVDVKNSHLINIYRPIGANTIGETHKYACYDIRGLDKAVCPKYVVSPWLQSSAEPDRSYKNLCA